jgi:hypothetical protein
MKNSKFCILSIMRSRFRAGIAISILLALASCGGDAESIPSQQWQGITIHVQSRPSPPEPGMNEFLVIATYKSGKPGYDLFVRLRTRDGDPWREAIEDGEEGVYRRAVYVPDSEHAVLQMKIKRNDTESILHFPLRVETK